MQAIKVKLKHNPYKVFIGRNILGSAGKLLHSHYKASKVLLVSNRKIYGLYGAKLKKSLEKYFDTAVILIPDGEKFKNMNTVTGILDTCAKNKFDRHSVIVALGGGVIGDIAGFAASIYMRGIRVVQVPTTLLAQTDSSIGGKTGVDLKAGKNMAGTFHQPLFVLSDTEVLKTLSTAEFRNGLAEVIKYGIIMDKSFFYYLLKNKTAIEKRDLKVLGTVTKKCSANKVTIVSKDEKEEKGLRAILNYGHTVGHAIEAASEYRYKHGMAVAMGMAIAAGLSYSMGISSKETYNEQIKALKSFNLIKPLKNVRISSILKRLYSDKKARNGKIRFVLTKKIGCVTFIESINIQRINEELQSFCAHTGIIAV